MDSDVWIYVSEIPQAADLNPQVWVLIGVILGAVSSFLGQWLLARQKRTADRAHDLRVTQRDVYAKFIAANHRARQAVSRFLAKNPAEDTVFEAFRDINVELQNCVGEVQLVSPLDTASAARQWSDATLLAHKFHKDEATSDAHLKREQEARIEFMKLARRDLGSD